MPRKRTPLLVFLVLPVSALFASQDEPKPEPPVLVSDQCARCHSNAFAATAMRDAQGREIAPHGLWSAVVSVEVAATPSRQADIEATCLRCHAPMVGELELSDHGTGSLMHVLDCDSAIGVLARDGVSCTICHGMSPGGLGEQASFSGGFELDGERRLFGPHQQPFTRPMQMHVRFTPTFGAHVTDSALCGTCHTLETEALAPDGTGLGVELVEQAPFLEWLNSAFHDEEVSCQSCHMPTVDEDGTTIAARIARNPAGRDFPQVKARQPFGRHVFVGGNTLVLGILRAESEALGVAARASALDATLAATRQLLQQKTARLEIGTPERVGRTLAFGVKVEGLTGHKFPTAHPTRRAFLHVVVRDRAALRLSQRARRKAGGARGKCPGRPRLHEVCGPTGAQHGRRPSGSGLPSPRRRGWSASPSRRSRRPRSRSRR